MLVQTITISFSSFAADTIRIHTGETGREILFAPDMEISGEYSADFIVIKPDDTFVIAAATITDGKINVVIPEQAGAVAGAGHYILKIYDSGSVCIYSASGGFMVDDHLLNDSMIESVAEAYGYRFPQDFAKIDDDATGTETTWSSEKIADAIASATPDIIDDENVLYDKTWSSEKISYELGNIQPLHVYSTTEQPVGRWIDGKMVYEKTYYLGSVPTTSTSSFSIDVPNVSRIIKLEGIIIGPYMAYPVNCWQNNTYANTYAYINMNAKAVVFYCGNMNGGTAHFTLQYTKNE